MVYVSCTPKPLDVLNGFQQVKKTEDLESLPSFSFGLTQLEEEERNVSVSCTPKPLDVFKPLDVLNGFQQFPNHKSL